MYHSLLEYYAIVHIIEKKLAHSCEKFCPLYGGQQFKSDDRICFEF